MQVNENPSLLDRVLQLRSVVLSVPYEAPENQVFLEGEGEEELCGRVATYLLVSCGDSYQFDCETGIDWEFDPTGGFHDEWTWQLNRHWELKVLAHQYLLTGDESYAYTACDIWRSWLTQVTCPGDSVSAYSTKAFRTIEIGIRLGSTWPYAMHALSTSCHMDEELLNSIYESVRQQAERLITCHTSGNWLLIEMNGLLHASMCFPGIKGTDTWHDFAADKLVAEVDRQFYEDGMHYELSTLYHEVAINNYCRYVCMAQALGKKVPEKITATLRKACLAEVLLMMPDGRLPNLNDGEWFDVATLLSSRPDGLVDDEILFWLMDRTTTPPTSLEGHHNHLFSHAGLVVMRDGWGKSDRWALMDAGPFGAGHQHEDKLSLLYHVGGKLLLTEAGNYRYDHSVFRAWSISSAAHNTVLVDGGGQDRRSRYKWRDENLRDRADVTYVSTDKISHASGIYQGWYEGGIFARHERRVYLMHGCDLLLVVDRLCTPGSHNFTVLWHIDSELESSAENALSFRDQRLLCQQDVDVRVVKGHAGHPIQGFVASADRNHALPIPCVEVAARGSEVRLVTAITGNRNFESLIADSDVQSTRICIITKDGQRLSFDEGMLAGEAIWSHLGSVEILHPQDGGGDVWRVGSKEMGTSVVGLPNVADDQKEQACADGGEPFHPIHVVIATDNAYGVPALVTVLSLVENACKDTVYHLHVMSAPNLDPAIIGAMNAMLGSRGMPRAHVVDMGSAYADQEISIAHTTVQTFYRLRIPSLIPCDTCLYLDVDTVVLSDLADLVSADLEGAYVAGVMAAGYYWPPEQRMTHARRLGFEELDQYVNAGVLVMNVTAMREDGIEREFERLAGLGFESQDQDVINVACHGRIRLLPPRYNSMTKYRNADPTLYGSTDMKHVTTCYSREEWEDACLNPVIVHYADRVKPWDSMAVEHAQDWWRYAILLKDWTPLADGLLDRIVASEVLVRDRVRKELSEQRSDIAKQRSDIARLKTFQEDTLTSLSRFAGNVTARIDFKLEGDSQPTLEVAAVSDAQARVATPLWFQDGGTGCVVESWAGEIEISVRALVSGLLRVWLRGRDERDHNNQRVARWMCYRSLTLSGVEYLESPCAVWHDKPKVLEIPVCEGDRIRVMSSWEVQSFESELNRERQHVDELERQLALTVQSLEAANGELDKMRNVVDSIKASKAYRLGSALAGPIRKLRKLKPRR